jgi:hypothetical protein
MIVSIAGITAALAAIAQGTPAVRVSIMGDRAEELGYPRPPGLTPAWTRHLPHHHPRAAWTPWNLPFIEDQQFPPQPGFMDQFPWMTDEQRSQIHRDFISSELEHFANLYDRAAEFYNSPTRGIIHRDIDAILARLAARDLHLRAADADKQMYEFYRDQQYFRLEEGEMALLTLIDAIRHIFGRNRWKGIPDMVRSYRRAAEMIGVPEDELERDYARQYRLLCNLIDEIAPWSL